MNRLHAPLVLTAVAALVLLPWSGGESLAQGNDIIGIYFDEAGTQVQTTTASPYGVVPVFLVVRNPSHTDGLGSWECMVGLVTDGPEPFMTWALNGQGINVFAPPSFAVGLATLLPSDQDVLLATGSIIVPEAGQKVSFFIRPQDSPSMRNPPDYGYPVYAPIYGHGDQNAFQSLVQNSGCDGLPVAEINPDGVVPEVALGGPSFVNLGPANETSPRTVTITNDGDHSISGTVALEGNGYLYVHGGNFYTTATTTFHLRPQAGLPVTVLFEETGEQANPGQLTVEACGVQKIVELATDTYFPVCEISPDVLDLGTVPLGAQDYGQFRISNTGDANLNVEVRVTGPDFRIPNDGPAVIYPHSYRDVDVIFAPTQPGPLQATVTFGSGGECNSLELYGEGVDTPPICSVSPGTLDFGEVVTTSSRQLTFAVRNNGGGFVEGEISLAAGSDGFTLVEGSGPYSLATYEEWTVTLEFSPTGSGLFQGLVLTGAQCGDVALTGIGVDANPACAVNPTALEWGDVQVGTYYNQTVIVSNPGNVPFVIFPTVDSGQFRILSPVGPVTLQPGSQRLVYVRFNPTILGPHEATLLIGETACPEVHLSGTGIPNTEHLDRVGIYFDEAYSLNVVDQVPAGVHPAYLVLKSPSVGGGVTAWQCGLTTTGSNTILAWNLAGDALNNGSGACFDVTLATPLPPAENILLLTADILVMDEWSDSNFHLSSLCFYPPVYYPGDDPLSPVTMRSATGDFWLARLNDSPLPVEMPSLISRVAGNEINLTWDYRGSEAEGFHVWRRRDGEAPVRLTDQTLTAADGRFAYTDRPGVIGPAVFHYACAAVKAGVEIGRSPETRVEFTGGSLPASAVLLQNYPNPFNPTTTIPFELGRPGRAQVAVFDLAGRQIAVLADRDCGAGRHEVLWSGLDQAGRRVPSGPYYARLKTEDGVRMRKMMLLK